MGDRQRVRHRVAVDHGRTRRSRQLRAERGGRIARERERHIGHADGARRIERGRMQRAPVAGAVVPREIRPVGFIHPSIQRGQHAGRAGRAARVLGAREQRADRHDRQPAPERGLGDARRGTQARERAGACAERDRVAIGERQPRFGEKVLDGRQHACARHGARQLVADPGLRVETASSAWAERSATEQYSVDVSMARSTVCVMGDIVMRRPLPRAIGDPCVCRTGRRFGRIARPARRSAC